MTHSIPLTLHEPLSMLDAREALQVLSKQRRMAETELRDQIDKAATAEMAARKALAQAFVSAEGGTAAEREANARSIASSFFYKRDLETGLVKACQERLHGLDGERASLHRLVEMSIALIRATEMGSQPAWKQAA